jgi:hypothetical protein
MRATDPSSSAHDPVTAMSWHRRRIRRARRRSRESAPQPVSRVATQAPEVIKPLIRRLVVFVPRGAKGARPSGPVVALGEPAAVPGPAC